MKPLVIFRHIDIEGPGYLAHFLETHGIYFHLVKVDQGDEIPRSLDDIGGLVFMGGPMSVNDDLPWIRQEISLIQRAAEAKLPILGHCLGAQLISKALGGDVVVNPVKEIGWHNIQSVDSRFASNWLGGIPFEFEAFHWHGETFTIPHGATNILQSHHCSHQAFVKDNILGMQFHIEVTLEMVRKWADAYRDELEVAHNQSPAVQTYPLLLDDVENRTMTLHKVADKLYGHWLRIGSNEQLPVL
jgi:GMP synthase-like glutamine amidotransferase